MISAFLCVHVDRRAAGEAKSAAAKAAATVVIHVGPYKTGSTTVQRELSDHASMLELDGWTVLRPSRFGQGAGWRQIRVTNVAACYKRGKKVGWVENQTEACLDWLGYTAQLKGTTKKVVMSDESFGTARTDVSQIATDLSNFHTRIVMVYRIFYDWIASLYRQNVKDNISETGFALWLTDEKMNKEAYHGTFTTAVYRRYAAHFSDIRVHTLGPSLMADIVCNDLTASRTCASFRKFPMIQMNVRRRGDSGGACLSRLQQQKLEHISVELHQAALGMFSRFPTSDFHDKAKSCFGNR